MSFSARAEARSRTVAVGGKWLNQSTHKKDFYTINSYTNYVRGLFQGYYMFMEVSFGYPGDIAELTSYKYFAASAACTMTYWYHMFGSGIGSLTVKVRSR